MKEGGKEVYLGERMNEWVTFCLEVAPSPLQAGLTKAVFIGALEPHVICPQPRISKPQSYFCVAILCSDFSC